MEPRDDRIARRLAEIRAEEAALSSEPAAPVVERREGGTLRFVLFLTALIVVAAGLIGVSVTLSRLAGQSMDDATRAGRATVTSCERHGPVTNKGFGYWNSCAATIAWDDGQTARVTVAAVFTPSDIGKAIGVGDVGRYRQSQELARADVDARPWLRWIGYALTAIALVPGLIAVLIIRGMFRRRR